MSFPRYMSYKNSGVEWIGEMPEHWQSPTLGSRFSIELGKMLDQSRITGHHLVPYLRNVDVQWGVINLGDLPEMDILDREINRYTVREGDLLVCEGGEIGRSAVVANTPGVIGFQKALHRLRPHSDGELPKFTYYTLCWAAATGILDSAGSSTISHLTGQQLRRCRFPTPSVEEQRSIAEFLDRETTKIDALVAEQQRLIELLKEKRQAVISHAVTKGLGPAAPMKDSGVEWLGEVPEHWSVRRIKRLIRSIEQGWSPQCEGYPVERFDEWGVLKVGCVNGGKFNPGENKALPATLDGIPSLGIASGDVLISRANTRELVGNAAVVEQDYPSLMLCDKLYRLKVDVSLCEPKFLVLCLGVGAARRQIELAATGASSSMVNIGQSTILDLELALPPIREQAAIIGTINRETARLDALTVEAQLAITLLQERRTALISAAVTGKIDVRGLVTADHQEEVFA